MKIYLASRYSRREEMEGYANRLIEAGFEVVSRWVYGGEEGKTDEEIALFDLEDVERADLVLSFTEPYRSSNIGGGRHVEFGYALALGILVDIVGEKETVFHHHPKVHQWKSIDEFLKFDGVPPVDFAA